MNTEIIVSVVIAFLLWDIADHIAKKLTMRRMRKALEKKINK